MLDGDEDLTAADPAGCGPARREAFPLVCGRHGQHVGLVDCLDFLGANLTGAQRATEAARIFGASQALRDAIGAVRSHRDGAIHDGFIIRVKGQVSAQEYDRAWFEGRAMTLEDTIEYALAIT